MTSREMTSRERFEAWMRIQERWEAWQAAEAETARRCATMASDAASYFGRALDVEREIRSTYPEAFK